MKKLLISILSLITIFNFANAYEEDQEFVDALDWMHENNLTQYYTPSGFMPENELTREQAAHFFVNFAMQVKWMEAEWDMPDYQDSDQFDETLAESINLAYQMDLMSWSDGNFMAKNNITRAEFFTVAVRMLEWEQDQNVDPWWENYFQKAMELELTQETNAWEQDRNISRYEAALILSRASDDIDYEEADHRVIKTEWYDRTFDPDEIEVEEWETVEFRFTSTGGTHDFYIPELDEWTQMLEEWETDSIVVSFEEAGEYEFICTRGSHAEEWMTGMINVVSDEEDEYVQHQVDEVAQWLNQAWWIDFLPNWDILITEKDWNLVHVQIDWYETTNIANTPEVDSWGQWGLMDIAVHPNFPDQNWIYLTYSAANDEWSSTYLARAQLNLEENELYNMEELFVADPHLNSQQHYWSRVNIDNEWYVYMTIWDRGDKTFDETHNSQNTQNHLGTTIRLNQDWSIPQDNPFVWDDEVLDEIYTYGHRNSQWMAIHPQTWEIWQSEHGEQDWDEINIIQEWWNYGWPIATYGCTYWMWTEIWTYPEDNPDTVNPVYYWECGSGWFPPAGMTFISTDTFPQWQWDLFLWNLAWTYLWHFEIDGEDVSESDPLLADRWDRIRDVWENLANWYIYVLVDDSDAPLLRISPSN